MFQELSLLLNGTPKKKLSEIQIGKSIDLLRQLPYFSQINSKLGADYLVLMLQTLQPFILREGFMLIGESDHYLLVDGHLTEEEAKYQASRPVLTGKKLDLSERDDVRFLARSDCKMIKIKKGPSAGFQVEKKLLMLQKQRKKAWNEMHVILGGEIYKQKYEFLQKIHYFESLGQFDFLDLASKSYVHEYAKANVTHKHGEIIQKIGCIITGKVKLNYPLQLSLSTRKRGIQLFRSEGDWLGLEQFLQKQNFQTSGEATTIGVMVLWIPKDIFQSKFNIRTNFQLISRLKGVIEAKKIILQKSLRSRKSKILDFQQQMQGEKAINTQLLDKIQNLQLIKDKRRSNFRRTKNGKDFYIPELVLHRVNFSSDPLNLSLPNVNLFPQDYQNTPISCTHLKQMQRLETNKNRSLERKRTHNTFIQKNPEQLYQTILEKIPRKPQQTSSQFIKTARQQKPNTHYNMSIYNNFRFNKQKERFSTVKAFKTLDLHGQQ